MNDLTIYSVTWNVNTRTPPNDLDLYPLTNLNPLPDFYTLSLQEVNAKAHQYIFDSFVKGQDPWTSRFRNSLEDKGYVKVKSYRLTGIILTVFCLRKHLIHVKNIETQYTRLSFGGFLGLKGCVTIRLNIYGISICFVNTHLSAHDHMLENRVQEYNQIVDQHTFKQEVTTHILYHDYIVWCGDLNFRLEENTLTHQEIVQAIESNALEGLLSKDQLSQVRKDGRAFSELEETKPTFPPTYKFAVGTRNYDQKRRPAWTDRILHLVNMDNYENVELQIVQSSYRSYMDPDYYKVSDHMPVAGLFSVKVFGPELARQRRIDDYGQIVNFQYPGGPRDLNEDGQESRSSEPEWFVGEECIARYTLEQGAHQYLDQWDWIGLFKDGFTSLEDYEAFSWASTCRRSGIPKSSTMQDSSLWSSGTYVLVYISASWSILGISTPFVIGHRTTIPIDEAEEVFAE